MKKLCGILFVLFLMLNYSIKAQINVNGNIYIGGNDDSVFIAKNTSVGFDTLYIGKSGMSIIQSPYLKCDAGAALYARGGINVYTVDPTKIQMDGASSINLLNITGNNKTFEVNVDPNVDFIQNLNFIDVLDNVGNVYLASNENEIKVLKNFKFSNLWAQTVTLRPRAGALDLYVGGTMTGNISANNLSYIVTTNQNTTLSRPVDAIGKDFLVGSGINKDSFFAPVKIIPTSGTSSRVRVASLSNASKYQPFLEGGGEREEYVNNLWYIDAPGINVGTVAMEHNPKLDIPEIRTNDILYYYPNDTATIIRYVGVAPNLVGGDSSFNKWETMTWANTRSNTTIADSKNNPALMIVQDTIHQYMQRTNVNDFSRYPYFAKVRYADDKAPLTGSPGKAATETSGHLTVPDYIDVMPSITGGNEITLTFNVKNEYRIFGYEVYRNDINDPTFDPANESALILAGTVEADAKTNFDSGRFVHTYKFVDNGISAVSNTTSFYYQIRPVGGTGRGIQSSKVTEAGYATTKKLTILGNPVSKVQGMIRYRFVSADIQYASLRVVLVNSAGSIVGINNEITPEQTKFYEDNTHFPTKDLAGGVYLLIAQATRDDGKVELFTTRIIVE